VSEYVLVYTDAGGYSSHMALTTCIVGLIECMKYEFTTTAVSYDAARNVSQFIFYR